MGIFVDSHRNAVSKYSSRCMGVRTDKHERKRISNMCVSLRILNRRTRISSQKPVELRIRRPLCVRVPDSAAKIASHTHTSSAAMFRFLISGSLPL